MPDNHAAIGNRLKQIRNDELMTQESYSTLLGIQRDKLSRIESGKTAIDTSTLALIGMNYGPEKLYWLITGMKVGGKIQGDKAVRTVRQIDTPWGHVWDIVGHDGQSCVIDVVEWVSYLQRMHDADYLLGLNSSPLTRMSANRVHRLFTMNDGDGVYFAESDQALCAAVTSEQMMVPDAIYIVLTKDERKFVGKVKVYDDGIVMYKDGNAYTNSIAASEIAEVWEVVRRVTAPGAIKGESSMVMELAARLAALESIIKP